MIDIKILRENPELVKATAAKRKCNKEMVDVDALYANDQQYLKLVHETETLRSERNRLSRECQSNPEARQKVKELKQELAEKEKLQEELKAKVDEAMTWLPNMLSPEAPEGESDADNVEIKRIGQRPVFDFKPRDHPICFADLQITAMRRRGRSAPPLPVRRHPGHQRRPGPRPPPSPRPRRSAPHAAPPADRRAWG